MKIENRKCIWKTWYLRYILSSTLKTQSKFAGVATLTKSVIYFNNTTI